eukprot:2641675-Rhodomonas_salina.1
MRVVSDALASPAAAHLMPADTRIGKIALVEGSGEAVVVSACARKRERERARGVQALQDRRAQRERERKRERERERLPSCRLPQPSRSRCGHIGTELRACWYQGP